MATRTIDISFLTKEEQESLLQVLKRDERVRKIESKRVKTIRRKSMHFDKRKRNTMKIFTGDWMDHFADPRWAAGKRATTAIKEEIATKISEELASKTEKEADEDKENINQCYREVSTIAARNDDVPFNSVSSGEDQTSANNDTIDGLTSRAPEIDLKLPIIRKEEPVKKDSNNEAKQKRTEDARTGRVSSNADGNNTEKSTIEEWFVDSYSQGEEIKKVHKAIEEQIVPKYEKSVFSLSSEPKSNSLEAKEPFSHLLSDELDGSASKFQGSDESKLTDVFVNDESMVVPIQVSHDKYQTDFSKLFADAQELKKEDFDDATVEPVRMDLLGQEFNLETNIDICRSLESIEENEEVVVSPERKEEETDGIKNEDKVHLLQAPNNVDICRSLESLVDESLYDRNLTGELETLDNCYLLVPGLGRRSPASVSDDGSYGDDPLSLVEFLDSLPTLERNPAVAVNVVELQKKDTISRQMSIDSITTHDAVLNVVDDLLDRVEKTEHLHMSVYESTPSNLQKDQDEKSMAVTLGTVLEIDENVVIDADFPTIKQDTEVKADKTTYPSESESKQPIPDDVGNVKESSERSDGQGPCEDSWQTTSNGVSKASKEIKNDSIPLEFVEPENFKYLNQAIDTSEKEPDQHTLQKFDVSGETLQFQSSRDSGMNIHCENDNKELVQPRKEFLTDRNAGVEIGEKERTLVDPSNVSPPNETENQTQSMASTVSSQAKEREKENDLDIKKVEGRDASDSQENTDGIAEKKTFSIQTVVETYGEEETITRHIYEENETILSNDSEPFPRESEGDDLKQYSTKPETPEHHGYAEESGVNTKVAISKVKVDTHQKETHEGKTIEEKSDAEENKPVPDYHEPTSFDADTMADDIPEWCYDKEKDVEERPTEQGAHIRDCHQEIVSSGSQDLVHGATEIERLTSESDADLAGIVYEGNIDFAEYELEDIDTSPESVTPPVDGSQFPDYVRFEEITEPFEIEDQEHPNVGFKTVDPPYDITNIPKISISDYDEEMRELNFKMYFQQLEEEDSDIYISDEDDDDVEYYDKKPYISKDLAHIEKDVKEEIGIQRSDDQGAESYSQGNNKIVATTADAVFRTGRASEEKDVFATAKSLISEVLSQAVEIFESEQTNASTADALRIMNKSEIQTTATGQPIDVAVVNQTVHNNKDATKVNVVDHHSEMDPEKQKHTEVAEGSEYLMGSSDSAYQGTDVSTTTQATTESATPFPNNSSAHAFASDEKITGGDLDTNAFSNEMSTESLAELGLEGLAIPAKELNEPDTVVEANTAEYHDYSAEKETPIEEKTITSKEDQEEKPFVFDESVESEGNQQGSETDRENKATTIFSTTIDESVCLENHSYESKEVQDSELNSIPGGDEMVSLGDILAELASGSVVPSHASVQSHTHVIEEGEALEKDPAVDWSNLALNSSEDSFQLKNLENANTAEEASVVDVTLSEITIPKKKEITAYVSEGEGEQKDADVTLNLQKTDAEPNAVAESVFLEAKPDPAIVVQEKTVASSAAISETSLTQTLAATSNEIPPAGDKGFEIRSVLLSMQDASSGDGAVADVAIKVEEESRPLALGGSSLESDADVENLTKSDQQPVSGDAVRMVNVSDETNIETSEVRPSQQTHDGKSDTDEIAGIERTPADASSKHENIDEGEKLSLIDILTELSLDNLSVDSDVAPNLSPINEAEETEGNEKKSVYADSSGVIAVDNDLPADIPSNVAEANKAIDENDTGRPKEAMNINDTETPLVKVIGETTADNESTVKSGVVASLAYIVEESNTPISAAGEDEQTTLSEHKIPSPDIDYSDVSTAQHVDRKQGLSETMEGEIEQGNENEIVIKEDPVRFLQSADGGEINKENPTRILHEEIVSNEDIPQPNQKTSLPDEPFDATDDVSPDLAEPNGTRKKTRKSVKVVKKTKKPSFKKIKDEKDNEAATSSSKKSIRRKVIKKKDTAGAEIATTQPFGFEPPRSPVSSSADVEQVDGINTEQGTDSPIGSTEETPAQEEEDETRTKLLASIPDSDEVAESETTTETDPLGSKRRTSYVQESSEGSKTTEGRPQISNEILAPMLNVTEVLDHDAAISHETVPEVELVVSTELNKNTKENFTASTDSVETDGQEMAIKPLPEFFAAESQQPYSLKEVEMVTEHETPNALLQDITERGVVDSPIQATDKEGEKESVDEEHGKTDEVGPKILVAIEKVPEATEAPVNRDDLQLEVDSTQNDSAGAVKQQDDWAEKESGIVPKVHRERLIFGSDYEATTGSTAYEETPFDDSIVENEVKDRVPQEPSTENEDKPITEEPGEGQSAMQAGKSHEIQSEEFHSVSIAIRTSATQAPNYGEVSSPDHKYGSVSASDKDQGGNVEDLSLGKSAGDDEILATEAISVDEDVSWTENTRTDNQENHADVPVELTAEDQAIVGVIATADVVDVDSSREKSKKSVKVVRKSKKHSPKIKPQSEVTSPKRKSVKRKILKKKDTDDTEESVAKPEGVIIKESYDSAKQGTDIVSSQRHEPIEEEIGKKELKLLDSEVETNSSSQHVTMDTESLEFAKHVSDLQEVFEYQKPTDEAYDVSDETVSTFANVTHSVDRKTTTTTASRNVLEALGSTSQNKDTQERVLDVVETDNQETNLASREDFVETESEYMRSCKGHPLREETVLIYTESKDQDVVESDNQGTMANLASQGEFAEIESGYKNSYEQIADTPKEKDPDDEGRVANDEMQMIIAKDCNEEHLGSQVNLVENETGISEGLEIESQSVGNLAFVASSVVLSTHLDDVKTQNDVAGSPSPSTESDSNITKSKPENKATSEEIQEKTDESTPPSTADIAAGTEGHVTEVHQDNVLVSEEGPQKIRKQSKKIVKKKPKGLPGSEGNNSSTRMKSVRRKIVKKVNVAPDDTKTNILAFSEGDVALLEDNNLKAVTSEHIKSEEDVDRSIEKDFEIKNSDGEDGAVSDSAGLDLDNFIVTERYGLTETNETLEAGITSEPVAETDVSAENNDKGNEGNVLIKSENSEYSLKGETEKIWDADNPRLSEQTLEIFSETSPTVLDDLGESNKEQKDPDKLPNESNPFESSDISYASEYYAPDNADINTDDVLMRKESDENIDLADDSKRFDDTESSHLKSISSRKSVRVIKKTKKTGSDGNKLGETKSDKPSSKKVSVRRKVVKKVPKTQNETEFTVKDNETQEEPPIAGNFEAIKESESVHYGDTNLLTDAELSNAARKVATHESDLPDSTHTGEMNIMGDETEVPEQQEWNDTPHLKESNPSNQLDKSTTTSDAVRGEASDTLAVEVKDIGLENQTDVKTSRYELQDAMQNSENAVDEQEEQSNEGNDTTTTSSAQITETFAETEQTGENRSVRKKTKKIVKKKQQDDGARESSERDKKKSVKKIVRKKIAENAAAGTINAQQQEATQELNMEFQEKSDIETNVAIGNESLSLEDDQQRLELLTHKALAHQGEETENPSIGNGPIEPVLDILLNDKSSQPDMSLKSEIDGTEIAQHDLTVDVPGGTDDSTYVDDSQESVSMAEDVIIARALGENTPGRNDDHKSDKKEESLSSLAPAEFGEVNLESQQTEERQLVRKKTKKIVKKKKEVTDPRETSGSNKRKSVRKIVKKKFEEEDSTEPEPVGEEKQIHIPEKNSKQDDQDSLCEEITDDFRSGISSEKEAMTIANKGTLELVSEDTETPISAEDDTEDVGPKKNEEHLLKSIKQVVRKLSGEIDAAVAIAEEIVFHESMSLEEGDHLERNEVVFEDDSQDVFKPDGVMEVVNLPNDTTAPIQNDYSVKTRSQMITGEEQKDEIEKALGTDTTARGDQQLNVSESMEDQEQDKVLVDDKVKTIHHEEDITTPLGKNDENGSDKEERKENISNEGSGVGNANTESQAPSATDKRSGESAEDTIDIRGTDAISENEEADESKYSDKKESAKSALERKAVKKKVVLKKKLATGDDHKDEQGEERVDSFFSGEGEDPYKNDDQQRGSIYSEERPMEETDRDTAMTEKTPSKRSVVRRKVVKKKNNKDDTATEVAEQTGERTVKEETSDQVTLAEQEAGQDEIPVSELVAPDSKTSRNNVNTPQDNISEEPIVSEKSDISIGGELHDDNILQKSNDFPDHNLEIKADDDSRESKIVKGSKKLKKLKKPDQVNEALSTNTSPSIKRKSVRRKVIKKKDEDEAITEGRVTKEGTSETKEETEITQGTQKNASSQKKKVVKKIVRK